MKLNIQLFAKTITTTITETAVGDSVANTSNISVKAYFKSGSSETWFSNKTLKIYLQRVEPNGTYTQVGYWSGSVSLSQGGSVSKTVSFTDIAHQDDGTLKVRAYFYIATGTSGLGTITESDTAKTLDCTTIARASTFNSLAIRINHNTTITLTHSITKKNTNFTDKLTFCGEDFTIANGTSTTTIQRGTTAYNTFYSTIGNNIIYRNFSASLQTYNGTTKIGSASTKSGLIASLNKLDDVENRTYHFDATILQVTDNNANSYITSTNANGTTYTSSHKVSEFTSGTTFLQSWSNPIISSQILGYYNDGSSSPENNYTFGNPIKLSGISTNEITLNGSRASISVNLGTSFNANTYYLNGSDGRTSFNQRSITIARKSWTRPSVNFTLTRRSSTSQYIDWTISWSYTSVSRTNGNLTPTLTASYTYNGTTRTLSTSGFSGTSGTISGTITLQSNEDYKYPVSGVASLTDMIDYKVHSTPNIPSGQPAIYCHKDSSSNNVVDIYGNFNVDGYIKDELVVESIRSKNMFDKNNIATGFTYTSTGGTTALSNAFVQYVYIPVKPNTTYTLGTTTNYTSETDYRLVICEYNSSKTFIQRNLSSSRTYTITTTSNTYYVRLCASTVTLDELQFEEGSTATTYYPYQNLDGQEVYSTSEIKIGTWIDGKPLYRKTTYISSLPNNTSIDYQHSISNIATITNFYGVITSGSGRYNINYYNGSVYAFTSVWNSVISIKTNTNLSSASARIAIEYTKTTD